MPPLTAMELNWERHGAPEPCTVRSWSSMRRRSGPPRPGGPARTRRWSTSRPARGGRCATALRAWLWGRGPARQGRAAAEQGTLRRW